MTRKKKNILRRVTEEEQIWLVRISRSQNEPAVHVARAKEILAIAAGNNYIEAARLAVCRRESSFAPKISIPSKKSEGFMC